MAVIAEIVTTVGILSGALVYGQTASEIDFPKEINEGVYNILPVYNHEINWANNTDKMHELYSVKVKEYKENNHILANNQIQNNAYNDDYYYNNQNINEASISDNSSVNNNSFSDDNKSYHDRNGSSIKKYKDLIMPNNVYQALIQQYKDAGYKHYIVRFPVGKYTPLSKSKSEFLKLLSQKNIKQVDVYGFASPDGIKPEMQENLSRNRMNKVIEYFKNNNVKIEYYNYHLCSHDVLRESCWRSDIFFKTDVKAEKE